MTLFRSTEAWTEQPARLTPQPRVRTSGQAAAPPKGVAWRGALRSWWRAGRAAASLRERGFLHHPTPMSCPEPVRCMNPPGAETTGRGRAELAQQQRRSPGAPPSAQAGGPLPRARHVAAIVQSPRVQAAIQLGGTPPRPPACCPGSRPPAGPARVPRAVRGRAGRTGVGRMATGTGGKSRDSGGCCDGRPAPGWPPAALPARLCPREPSATQECRSAACTSAGAVGAHFP